MLKKIRKKLLDAILDIARTISFEVTLLIIIHTKNVKESSKIYRFHAIKTH